MLRGQECGMLVQVSRAGLSDVRRLQPGALWAWRQGLRHLPQRSRLVRVPLQRWLNPATLTPEILPGDEPYWPPGFELASCSSSDSGECTIGCELAFNPELSPLVPHPTPPPDTPPPPAPWPNSSPGFNFSAALSSHMVLQQGPGASAVFGNVGSDDPSAQVAVTVTPSSGGGEVYTVSATINAGRWKALLQPTSAVPGVTYTINATCTSGCGDATPTSIVLEDIAFGDVFYCFGQSSASVEGWGVVRQWGRAACVLQL
jgi:hypothetical protein